jgi:hypothetical protein
VSTPEESARQLLTPHLWGDEEILWSGRPHTTAAVAAAAARKGFWGTIAAVSGLAVFFLYAAVSFTRKDDLGGGVFFVVLGAVIIGAVLIARTAAAWMRGRHAAAGTAYGVTNRRVMIVRGDELDWIGPRQLEDVAIRGQDVVITRQRSEIESLWDPEAPGFDDEHPGQGLIEHANAVAHRELTLNALSDPRRVASLIQTLKPPAAS